MDKETLEEIADWKLEAKLEDTHRYFYHIDELKRIENGSRCYVIGRKGSGKTAISEYLLKEERFNTFSLKLSFKNFPFNDLYKLDNNSYQSPNQYITLWKFIIYSSIAKLFIKNRNIDSTLRSKLEKVYIDDPEISLPRTISRWTGKNFDVGILGNKVATGKNHTISENDLQWIEKVEILENLIRNNIDESSYRIIFDELDEDYRDVLNQERYSQYGSLLTSLFKAVQDVKYAFPNNQFSVLPVIFLRDDIYSILNDPDKTKWGDLSIELDWNTDQIKNLLAFRLSRAVDADNPPLEFENIWRKIFSKQPINIGTRQRKSLPIFDYITRSSQIRPRDYIRYIKACADEALSRNDEIISAEIVKKVDKAFSNYLRSELEDEIHGFLPEIKQIINIIAQIRKQEFSLQEFSKAYLLETKRGSFEERNVEFVLTVLFIFSIIGNQPKQRNKKVFRYLNKEARINFNEKFCVHRGLLKALQIF